MRVDFEGEGRDFKGQPGDTGQSNSGQLLTGIIWIINLQTTNRNCCGD